MGFIYKVTNKINGNIYIGQTTQTIEKRWKQHIYEANKSKEPYKSALHRAIKKYGKDSFNVEEVEKCNNDDLDNREIYWIAYFDSYHNGYNLDLGGNGSRRCDDEKLMKLWDDGCLTSEIANILGFNRSTISNHLNALGITKDERYKRGAQHANSVKADNRQYYSHYVGKTVYQYDINGNYIQSFDNCAKAADYIHGSKDSIMAVCKGRMKQTCGYQWRYEKYNKIESISYNETKNTKMVYQYDIDGQFIQSFESSEEAARILKCDASAIRRACAGKLNQTGGFQWRHEKYDCINSVKNKAKSSKKKEVYQYDMDGNYIQSFNNVREASIIFGDTKMKKIPRVCREEVSQAFGFIWRYYKVEHL